MPPAPPLPDFIWIQNVVFPILGMAMGALFLFAAYRTVNRWLDRRHEHALAEAPGGGVDVTELRRRVDALEDVVYRVQELEERVDFTERMLAAQREGRLPGGGRPA